MGSQCSSGACDSNADCQGGSKNIIEFLDDASYKSYYTCQTETGTSATSATTEGTDQTQGIHLRRQLGTMKLSKRKFILRTASPLNHAFSGAMSARLNLKQHLEVPVKTQPKLGKPVQDILKQQREIKQLTGIVCKIQALWKGFKARKAKLIGRPSDKKYFTDLEFWETIQRSRVYSKDIPLQYASFTYRCSGAIYEGEMRGGFREGKGRMIWKDGTTYEGQWLLGRACGEGKIRYANGDQYKGTWYYDQYHGYGLQKSKGGATYEGWLKFGKKHGKGTEIWPDGQSYNGNYENDEKEGFGTYVWPSGSIYAGHWSHNLINGIVIVQVKNLLQGLQQWSDGRQYEGQFKENMMDGMGFYTYQDGKTYLGSYQSDIKQGYGVLTWPDGKIFAGWWNKGRQDGYGTFIRTDEEGTKHVLYGIWKEGVRERWLTKQEADQLIRTRQLEKPEEFDAKADELKRSIIQLAVDKEQN